MIISRKREFLSEINLPSKSVLNNSDRNELGGYQAPLRWDPVDFILNIVYICAV